MGIESEMKRLNATPLQKRIDPSESRVRQLESSIGVAFPSSYREFLSKFGRYSVNAGIACKTLPGAYISYFYGFPDDDDAQLNPDCELNELNLAPTAITIGSDDWGNQIVMFLDDGLHGRVYVYEHDGGADFRDDPHWQRSGLSWGDLQQYDESDSKPSPFANLHYVASDFLSFLQSLTSNAGADSA